MRLPGATVEQLEQWLPLAWGAAKGLTATDEASPDFTTEDLTGEVRLDERWLSLVFWGHAGSLLHQLARHVADLGQPALVEERESFHGEAPYLAMTAYLPGKPAELRLFDPLRAETARRPIPEAWLSRFCGYGGTVEQCALEEDGVRGQLLRYLPVLARGRLAERPQLLGEKDYFAWLARLGQVERVGARGPRAAELAEGIAFASAVLSLLLVAPIALIVPAALIALMKPAVQSDFTGAVVAAWCIGGWGALVPLRWPGGEVIRWPLRLAWFLGWPVLVALLVGLS